MTREVYAVYRFGHGYLRADGTYSEDDEDALTWDRFGDARDAAIAAGLGEIGRDFEIVPLQQERPRRTRR